MNIEDADVLELCWMRKHRYIDTDQMLEAIFSMEDNTTTPTGASAWDGYATAQGKRPDIVRAFRAGLLSEDEYELIREGMQ